MDAIIGMALSMAGICLFCMLAVAIECRFGADPQRHRRAAAFNMTYFVLAMAAAAPLASLAKSGGMLVVNTTGGGFVVLPATGWCLAASVIAFLILTDFLEYAFHRAQHEIPLLWRMHSLHHSEEQMNATTTMRHFWLEGLLRVLLIAPIAGVVFKADPTVILVAEMVRLANHVYCHMSLRRNWGRLWWLLDSPQYHRLHHSVLPQHLDRNFADLLPVWDILFGTAFHPAPDEYPSTGLVPSPRVSLGRALVWPLRTA